MLFDFSKVPKWYDSTLFIKLVFRKSCLYLIPGFLSIHFNRIIAVLWKEFNLFFFMFAVHQL